MTKRSFRGLASATLLAALLLGALPTGTGQERDELVWEIREEVHCRNTEIVEDRTILIVGDGKLVLEGCTLTMASAPYQDTWIGGREEGLKIHLLFGGTLELRHSGTRPAILQAADPRYGYEVDVDGLFVSDGRDGEPNLVRNLEGYMAEAFIGGGLHVFDDGRAYINHTRFQDLQGPAIFVDSGGAARARSVEVGNASGAFAALGGLLEIDGADVNTGIEGIRVSQTQFSLANATILTDRIGIHATHSDVTIRDSTVEASGTSVVLEEVGTVVMEGCRLDYGKGGIIALREPEAELEPRPSLRMDGCTVAASGMQEETIGLSVQGYDLEVAGSRLNDHTQSGITLVDGHLEVVDSTFNGLAPTDLFVSDPTQWRVEGNEFSALATKPVRLFYHVDAEVLEGEDPVTGAVVRLGSKDAQTGSTGQARIRWEVPLGADFVPLENATTVTAEWRGDAQDQEATPTDHDLVFLFEGKGGDKGSPAAPIPLAAAALVALAALARRRLRQA